MGFFFITSVKPKRCEHLNYLQMFTNDSNIMQIMTLTKKYYRYMHCGNFKCDTCNNNFSFFLFSWLFSYSWEKSCVCLCSSFEVDQVIFLMGFCAIIYALEYIISFCLYMI